MVHQVLLKLMQFEQRPWCMASLPFLSTPLVTRKITEGADDLYFGGMGAGGAADDRREKAEALVGALSVKYTEIIVIGMPSYQVWI